MQAKVEPETLFQNQNSFNLRVETIDKKTHNLVVFESCKVSELKNEIAKTLFIEEHFQTLIFKNKRLSNEQLLKQTGIKNNSKIYLVASCLDEQIPHRNRDSEIISNILKNLAETASTRVEMKLKNLQKRTFGFSLLEKESKEVIHQNLTTIFQLNSCRQESINSSEKELEHKLPYLLENREFKLGQWIDVKDSTDQWTEAEIIELGKTNIKIRYNGRETRWDESIDKASPRIAPFKSHTVQSSTTYYLSPVPTTQLSGSVQSENCSPVQISELYKNASNALKSTKTELKQLIQMFQNKAKPKNNKLQTEVSINEPSNSKVEGRNFNQNPKLDPDNKSHFSLKINDNEGNPTSLLNDTKSVRIGDEGANFRHRMPKKDSLMAHSPRSTKSIRSQLSSRLAFDHEDNYFQEPQDIIPEDLNQEISFDFEKEKNSLKTNQFCDYSIEEKNVKKKNQESKVLALKASQLAPIFDRLGRSLVDLSPHMAALGSEDIYNNRENLPSHSLAPNVLGLFNRFRPEHSDVSNPNLSSNSLIFRNPVDFQIPVMLTPGEIFAVTNPNVPFIHEQNIDLNLHAVVRTDAFQPRINRKLKDAMIQTDF